LAAQKTEFEFELGFCARAVRNFGNCLAAALFRCTQLVLYPKK